MIVHELGGCAPAPLAHYLKALGVLRLVAEQADPAARGWWEGERFLLASTLEEDELLAFFLERYAPTPMFNPWGARSGFYAGSPEKTSRVVLKRIEESNSKRFTQFQQAIASTRGVIERVTGGAKPDDANKKLRSALVLSMRSELRNAPLAWLEAVIAVVSSTETGDSGLQQPAILGTGGSEGSGSYTAAFMKALDECLISRAWDCALRPTILGDSQSPGQIWSETFGQFLPTGIGNPWDLILAFEGACLVRSSVVKRSESAGDRWLSSPFFVAPVAGGFSSSARLDEFVLNKGKKLPGRGEQWFPLWAMPATKNEIELLFRQGRAMARGRRPTDGLSMARAVMGLGVSRGVAQFVRFGYLQRNNQATHFAVPLGRFVVPAGVSPVLACLDDLDGWRSKLRRIAHDDKAPARLRDVERSLTDALFAVVQQPADRLRWQAVLGGLADVEAVMVSGSGFAAQPVPPLRPEWVQAADDGSAEFRLALSLALQGSALDGVSGMARDGVRRHWLPLKPRSGPAFETTGRGSHRRLAQCAEVVMQGRSGTDDAIALVRRRLIEAAQKGNRTLPLVAARGAAAESADLAWLIAGEYDLDRTLRLARAMMALSARDWAANPLRPQPAPAGEPPDDAWMALRLALLPWPLPNGRKVPVDASAFRRLEAGDAATALELARRRLQAAGIQCGVRFTSLSPASARRWAAAMAFPISWETATRFVRFIDPNALMEIRHAA